MNCAIRVVLAFVITGVATVNLATLAASGYQPAPELEPLPLELARPIRAADPRGVARSDAVVPIDGLLRRGWLYRPIARGDAEAGAPALVLIPGSGAHDRNALAEDARALAGSGVATLVIDQRTDGYGPARRDYDRLAADAVASARWLSAQPGIDRDRIGLMGWSEGGWIAPLAAAQDPATIAYVVLVSAPVVSPLEQVGHLIERSSRDAPGWLHRLLGTVLAGGPNVARYVGTDIRPQLEVLRQPVYAVWGADDAVVPVNEAIRRLRAAVPGASVSVLPARGHTFAVDQP